MRLVEMFKKSDSNLIDGLGEIRTGGSCGNREVSPLFQTLSGIMEARAKYSTLLSKSDASKSQRLSIASSRGRKI